MTSTLDRESLIPFAIQVAPGSIHTLPAAKEELPEQFKNTWTEFLLRLWIHRVSNIFRTTAKNSDQTQSDTTCLYDSYKILRMMVEDTPIKGTPKNTMKHLPFALISIAKSMETELGGQTGILNQTEEDLEIYKAQFQKRITDGHYILLATEYPQLKDIVDILAQNAIPPSCRDRKDTCLNVHDLALAFKGAVHEQQKNPSPAIEIPYFGQPPALHRYTKTIEAMQKTTQRQAELIQSIRELGNNIADRMDMPPAYSP